MSEAASVVDEYGFPIDSANVDAFMVFNFKHKEKQPKIDEEWSNLLKKSSTTNGTKWRDVIVRRGIPKDKRIQVWMTVSGALKNKQHADANNSGESFYLDLVRKNKKKKLESFQQIEKDLHRTFADHPRFHTEQMIEALRRVCEAFARKNKAIGYCQSMSYIVGRMLLLANDNEESDVFWLLSAIVEDICVGYYNTSLIGTQIEQRVVEELIATHNPELYQHIQQLSVSLPLIVTKWIMCIFATSLPSECVYRIWDLMFAYGGFTIPRVCFAIFRILEPQLLNVQDTMSFCRLVDQEVSKMFDFKVIRNAMTDRDFKEATHQDNLTKLREKHTAIVEHEMEQIRQNRNIMKLTSLTHFSRKELQDLSQQFKVLANQNKEGAIKRDTYIKYDQFSQVMKKNFARLQDDDAAIEQLFKAFDADGDNTIDFRELMIGLSILTKGSFDERIELCFKAYDLDNSGFLDKNELEKMIMSVFKQTLNTSVGGLSVTKYVEVVFLNLDTNKDGQLSFEEFKRVAVIEPQLVQCFLGDETAEQAGNNNEEQTEEAKSPAQESVAPQPAAEPKVEHKSEAKIQLVDPEAVQRSHDESQPLIAPKQGEQKQTCCCVIL